MENWTVLSPKICPVLLDYGLEAEQEKRSAMQISLNMKLINLYFEQKRDGFESTQRMVILHEQTLSFIAASQVLSN